MKCKIIVFFLSKFFLKRYKTCSIEIEQQLEEEVNQKTKEIKSLCKNQEESERKVNSMAEKIAEYRNEIKNLNTNIDKLKVIIFILAHA